MKKLNMESAIKIGTNAEKKISELVNEKGYILSLIKDGYIFDDEVLKSANITHTIRDEHFENVVIEKSVDKNQKMRKDSASTKQIISELNSINNTSDTFNDNSAETYENQIDNITFEEDEE